MNTLTARTLILLLVAVGTLQAQAAQLINYQGRVTVNGVNFDGSGQFKFALVDGAGNTSYWSNDGTSSAGSEPAAAVTLTVINGQYSVLLGDRAIPNMAAIPEGVLDNTDVLLRVWFNDGTNGSQQLTPDQLVATPVPFNARVTRDNPATETDCWQQREFPHTGRYGHTAVWTGSEMIVWGGEDDSRPGGLNDGYRYDPARHHWSPLSAVGAPARGSHTTIWTGSEMIVWGRASGSSEMNSGGRYNPVANSWTAVNTTGAPSVRSGHTAVWTGSEMIVWGGWRNAFFNDGGRYSPAGDHWAIVTTTDAPAMRAAHTAVWTGSEMIVWGGSFGSGNYLNDGGRYDPAKDGWTMLSMTGAPTLRASHGAVWTGSEMIVWGGRNSNGVNQYPRDGGRYSAARDGWTATTTTGAPSPRAGATAVWTGSEMIVWGGYAGESGELVEMGTGGRYNPEGNTWRGVTTLGAPTRRTGHTAVWTGSEMIVWGGRERDEFDEFVTQNNGGRYRPAATSWEPVYVPSPRYGHTALWMSGGIFIWGGKGGNSNYLSDGAIYQPADNDWMPTGISGVPAARYGHTAVWTGNEVIVWGGYNGSFLNNGGRYFPAFNGWIAVSNAGAPAGRTDHTAVWTGSEMIVWGGVNGSSYMNTGGRYDPAGNSWTPMTTGGAPSGRRYHTAVWTGDEVIVWGGANVDSLNGGGRYDPGLNSWTAVQTDGAPSARNHHTAVWTGREMIVWGGRNDSVLNDGAHYHPATGTWMPATTEGAPEPRSDHTAVWTGREMIVWGGKNDNASLNTGGRYHPAENSWAPMTTTGAPAGRHHHTAVWTGSEMIVWGGTNDSGLFNDTFSYIPDCRVFDFTSVVRNDGNLTLTCPTLTGRTYTLWRSESLEEGTWTRASATSLAGTGGTLTFTVPDTGMARCFFRVQADPTP